MFCIAAFIVLAVISIFSARYRRMAKQAWQCVGRRITLRPCDTSFKAELKSRLLAKVAVRTPKLEKAASIGLEVAAFLIVVLTVWSLFVVVKSGLNLYVYGTCNPSNAESCSIGAEACSISTATPGFVESIRTLKPHTWIASEASSFAETVAAVPTRMQNWKAESYLPANVSYEKPYDSNKPTALDVFDPGCQYCRALYKNQLAAGFADRYNVAYIAYPIANPEKPGEYKFKHSMLVARYLEAAKLHPLPKTAGKDATPADWQLLDRIFTGKDAGGQNYQVVINTSLSAAETEALLQSWLRDMGYTDEQITELVGTAKSAKVTNAIAANRKIVDERIKTVKIPTLIFDGQRHGGVLAADKLK